MAHYNPGGLYNSTISASLQRLLKAKKEDEYVNFNEVCRACLSSKNELTDIRDLTVGDMSVQDVFEKYISIPIVEQDNLPKQICTICLYELCRMYLFINNCREADAKLKDLVLKAEEKGNEEMYHSTLTIAENGQIELAGTAAPEEMPQDLLKMGPLKVQEPGPPFICNNCSANFDTLAEIKAHRTKNKHYVVRQYLCRVCNPSKVFSYRHWRNHMRVHTGEKPYECHLCGRRFSVQGNKERHVLTHSGIKPYSCEICGKSYGQKTNLKLHNLRAHLGQKVERVKGEFACDRCGKIFTTKGALCQHRVIHDEKRFLCQECGKSFHYKLQFNLHMDGHRGVRRYKCPICGKAFTRPISLALHKRTHTGHKPYQCKYCERRFAQKSHLVTHTRTHTGERPYECPYCLKTFALNGNLTVHIRKHTGEVPYVCDICHKGFADSSSMKNHRKKHNGKDYNNMCAAMRDENLEEGEMEVVEEEMHFEEIYESK